MIVLGGGTAELHRVAFSPDGAEVAACGSGPLFAWRAGRRRVLAGGYGYDLAYTPDGRWLVIQQTAGQPGEPAGLYALDRRRDAPPRWLAGGWLLASGARLVVRGADPPWPLVCHHPTGPDFPLAWDVVPAGGPLSVATALPDGRVSAVELLGDRLFLTLRAADTGEVEAETLIGDRGGWLTASPDGGRLLLAADTRVRVWRTADLAAPPEAASLGRRELQGLVWHPSGTYLLGVGADGAVRRLDAASWAVTATYQWPAGKARAVAVAPDGLTAAAATSRGKVVVFDLD